MDQLRQMSKKRAAFTGSREKPPKKAQEEPEWRASEGPFAGPVERGPSMEPAMSALAAQPSTHGPSGGARAEEGAMLIALTAPASTEALPSSEVVEVDDDAGVRPGPSAATKVTATQPAAIAPPSTTMPGLASPSTELGLGVL